MAATEDTALQVVAAVSEENGLQSAAKQHDAAAQAQAETEFDNARIKTTTFGAGPVTLPDSGKADETASAAQVALDGSLQDQTDRVEKVEPASSEPITPRTAELVGQDPNGSSSPSTPATPTGHFEIQVDDVVAEQPGVTTLNRHPTETPYEILQVPADASYPDIKKSYRKLALLWHPDRVRDNQEEAEKQCAKLNQAYEILSSPQLRSIFDQYGYEGLETAKLVTDEGYLFGGSAIARGCFWFWGVLTLGYFFCCCCNFCCDCCAGKCEPVVESVCGKDMVCLKMYRQAKFEAELQNVMDTAPDSYV
eukprot:m.52092 g.52092  ORF g.52092 m.52092 type:complete len:308 (+) comp12265_c0_seq1:437-1360(+)